MAFQNNEFTVTLTTFGEDAWGIEFHVKGYEEAVKKTEWNLSRISWKTYNEVVRDDVLHTVVNVWVETSRPDVFELIELVKKVVLGPA